jgi:Tfp pilus assembly protein PilV
MNIKKSRKAISGQTLIEALIAVLFIAGAAIAIIRLQSYLSYNNSVAQQKGDAVILAISKIEELRNFQVLNNTSGYTSYQSIATGTSTTTIANTNYTLTWTVTPNTSPTYKNLNVLVSWTDRTGTAQSIRQISIVAGIDPQNSSAIM